jgi:hypothetical protein
MTGFDIRIVETSGFAATVLRIISWSSVVVIFVD